MAYSVRFFKPNFRKDYNIDAFLQKDNEDLRVDESNGLSVKEGMNSISSVDYNSIEPPIFDIEFYVNENSDVALFFSKEKHGYIGESFGTLTPKYESYQYLSRLIRIYRDSNVIFTGIADLKNIKYDKRKNKIKIKATNVLSQWIASENWLFKSQKVNAYISFISDRVDSNSRLIKLESAELFNNKLTKYINNGDAFLQKGFAPTGDIVITQTTPDGTVLTKTNKYEFREGYDLKCKVLDYENAYYELENTRIGGIDTGLYYDSDTSEVTNLKFNDFFSIIRTVNYGEYIKVYYITFLKCKMKTSLASSDLVTCQYSVTDVYKNECRNSGLETYIDGWINDLPSEPYINWSGTRIDYYNPFYNFTTRNKIDLVLNDVNGNLAKKGVYDGDLTNILTDECVEYFQALGIENVRQNNGFDYTKEIKVVETLNDSSKITVSLIGSEYFKYGYTDLNFSIFNIGYTNIGFTVSFEGVFNSKELPISTESRNEGGQPYVNGTQWEIIKSFLLANNMFVYCDEFGDFIFKPKNSINQLNVTLNIIELVKKFKKFETKNVTDLLDKIVSSSNEYEYKSLINNYIIQQISRIKNAYTIKALIKDITYLIQSQTGYVINGEFSSTDNWYGQGVNQIYSNAYNFNDTNQSEFIFQDLEVEIESGQEIEVEYEIFGIEDSGTSCIVQIFDQDNNLLAPASFIYTDGVKSAIKTVTNDVSTIKLRAYTSLTISYDIQLKYVSIKNSDGTSPTITKEYKPSLNDFIEFSSERYGNFNGLIAGYRNLNGKNLYELEVWEII